MAYDFLKNVEKYIKEKEDAEKKVLLGRVVSSLQRPMQEVINLTVNNQINNLNTLLQSLYKK